jgi:zinc finger CCHC domain-containing protein 9
VEPFTTNLSTPGFRVKKEDCERLRELHKRLVAEKVSHAEMKEALKKERRRAEKALSNLKKFVCYYCRQPGHALADCPGKKSRF